MGKNVKTDYTRKDLKSLCWRGMIDQSRWADRDSADAVAQLGKAYAFLRAGCKFEVLKKDEGDGCITDAKTIWVRFWFKGFSYFEGSSELETDIRYIPTHASIKAAAPAGDWY